MAENMDFIKRELSVWSQQLVTRGQEVLDARRAGKPPEVISGIEKAAEEAAQHTKFYQDLVARAEEQWAVWLGAAPRWNLV